MTTFSTKYAQIARLDSSESSFQRTKNQYTYKVLRAPYSKHDYLSAMFCWDGL